MLACYLFALKGAGILLYFGSWNDNKP